jgi:drug/metabolite transporter (DMT)-like permease
LNPSDRVPLRVLGVMGVAVLAVSAAAPMVRLAEGVHPVAVGFWRTAGVGLILLPAVRPISRKDALWTVLAGAFLALHFWAWFASLAHTTVMRSTLLVTLNPVWTALVEWLGWKEPPRRAWWIGLGVAVPGVLLLAGGGDSGSATWFGDALALLGGVFGSLYLLVGRRVRQRVGIASYAGMVSMAAAAVLLPLALLLDAPLWGYGGGSWLALLGLTVGPQLLGHNGFLYSVKYIKASVASVFILLEPVGAALLAVVLFAEVPGMFEVVGGALVLLGVALATRSSD